MEKMAMKTTILLVDKEEIVRTELAKALEKKGYTVYTAEDGASAILCLHKKPERYNVVLADTMLPTVDGFELAKYIRDNLPKVRIILSSNDANLKKSMEAKEAGACDFVVKPYERLDLFEAIDRACSKK